MEQESKWEVVFRTGNQVEAEIVRGLLTTSNIPVVVEAKGLKSMVTLFGNSASGELLLKVPPDLADLARDLLAAEAETETEGQADA